MTSQEKITKGLRLIKEDNYSEAFQVLGEAYILKPNDKELLKVIAYLWQRINDGNFDLIPETAEQFIMRGNARLYKQEFDGAYNDYTKAISLDSQCDFAFKCRGFVLALQSKHDEALREYKRAIDLNPKRGEYWDDAATSYQAIRNVYQAHLCHESAIRASPDDARLWFNYGVFFAEFLNDLDSALEKFNRAIEILPMFEDAIANRNQLLEIKRNRK